MWVWSPVLGQWWVWTPVLWQWPSSPHRKEWESQPESSRICLATSQGTKREKKAQKIIPPSHFCRCNFFNEEKTKAIFNTFSDLMLLKYCNQSGRSAYPVKRLLVGKAKLVWIVSRKIQSSRRVRSSYLNLWRKTDWKAIQRVLGSCSSSCWIVQGRIPQGRFCLGKFLQQGGVLLPSTAMIPCHLIWSHRMGIFCITGFLSLQSDKRTCSWWTSVRKGTINYFDRGTSSFKYGLWNL